jgi:hypothetical protein
MKFQTEILRWRLQVAFVRGALFFVRAAGPVRLGPELNAFFADRYLRLSVHYRGIGKVVRANRMLAMAAEHWRAQDPESPPPSAAAAMPVPLPPLFTWLVASSTEQARGRKAA